MANFSAEIKTHYCTTGATLVRSIQIWGTHCPDTFSVTMHTASPFLPVIWVCCCEAHHMLHTTV